MSETTFKGDIAELMAAAELVRRGYVVSRPLTNGAAYDLLVDDGHRILRAQVKRASRRANGSLRVSLQSSKYHRGRRSVGYLGRIDVLIAVDCDRGAFFVIAGPDLAGTEVSLRDSAALNSQTSGIRKAADYALSTVFPGKVVVGATGIEPVTLPM